jgi:hypothetical protein
VIVFESITSFVLYAVSIAIVQLYSLLMNFLLSNSY